MALLDDEQILVNLVGGVIHFSRRSFVIAAYNNQIPFAIKGMQIFFLLKKKSIIREVQASTTLLIY